MIRIAAVSALLAMLLAFPAAGQGEVDAALELYTARLTYEINHQRANPPPGITKYTEGIVQVRIDINEQGLLSSRRILKSSGNPLLDRYAVDILGEIAPRTTVPFGLANRAFFIAVTIDFSS